MWFSKDLQPIVVWARVMGGSRSYPTGRQEVPTGRQYSVQGMLMLTRPPPPPPSAWAGRQILSAGAAATFTAAAWSQPCEMQTFQRLLPSVVVLCRDMPVLCCAVLCRAVLVRWQDLTTTLDGPEVCIFKEACRKNKVRLEWASRGQLGQETLQSSVGSCLMRLIS